MTLLHRRQRSGSATPIPTTVAIPELGLTINRSHDARARARRCLATSTASVSSQRGDTVELGTGSDARGIDYTDSDGTNGLGWILVDANPATAAFLPILELGALAKVRPSLSHVLAKEKYIARFYVLGANYILY